MSSDRLDGKPESVSTTSRTPSGGFLCKSRTSRANRARVRGGKFSLLTDDEDEEARDEYCRIAARAAVEDDDMMNE